MRIRRSFSAGSFWARTWDRVTRTVRGWIGRLGDLAGRRPAPVTIPDRSPPADHGALAEPRSRPGFRVSGFAWLALGIFVGTLVAGYLIAALFLFPAPIFASNRSVPRLIGLPADDAREQLRDLGLSAVEVDRVTHPEIPSGRVVWQDPPPDMLVPEGGEVRITLSAGPQRIPVPDVAEYDADNARLLIEAAGLTVGRIESVQAPTPANVAVNTRPPAGTTLLPGSEVTLVVSVGAATIRVPSLIGLTLDSARVVLEDAGLALGTNYARRSNAVEPGRVFFQEPQPGTLSAPGTLVNVILASENRQ